MSDRTCPGFGCDTQLRDGFLCRRCQHRAERALGDLPALARELEVTITRQDRLTDPGKRGTGHAQPLPVSLAASARGREVFELLFEWADYVAQWNNARGLPVFAAYRPLTELVPEAVAILLRYTNWMRNNDQGPNLVDAVHSVRRDARRIIDQPPARLYAGPCDADLGYEPELGYRCSLPLFRKWGADDVQCDGHNPDKQARRQWLSTGCGQTHPATERDQFMYAAAEDHVLPLRLIFDSLHVLIPDCALEWKTVQQWTKERRQRVVIGHTASGREKVRIVVTPPRLLPVSIDSTGRELFKGKDVLQLAKDGEKRRGRRRVQRVKVA